MEQQYRPYVLFVEDKEGKKYLNFDFIIVPSNSLPNEMIVSDGVNDESFAIVSKRPINYVSKIKNATVMDNRNEFTKHIHGVYYEELSKLQGYMGIEEAPV